MINNIFIVGSNNSKQFTTTQVAYDTTYNCGKENYL